MSPLHRTLPLVSILLAATGCGLVAQRTTMQRSPRVVAPPPVQLASEPASATLATVQSARYPGWEPVVPTASCDFAAFSAMHVPTAAGRCYVVLAAIDAGSTWPARTAPLEVNVDGATQPVNAYLVPEPGRDVSGPFDGLHPYARSQVFCAARDGDAELRPRSGGRTAREPSTATARGEVLVISRDLLDLASLRETPAGWPAGFLLLPGSIESDSSGATGTSHMRAIRVQATITSPELADLFYQHVAERAGLRLTQHDETVQPDGPTAYMRTYSGRGQSWNVYFFRAVTGGGSLGTVTALQTVTERGSARAER